MSRFRRQRIYEARRQLFAASTFVEIQIVLHTPQGFLSDDVFITQADNRPAGGVAKLLFRLPLHVLCGLSVMPAGMIDVIEIETCAQAERLSQLRDGAARELAAG